ncbi:hypothetical protein JCM5350_001523 [Sporobolomyces pararoseus]
MATPVVGEQHDVGLSRDGEPIKDPSYYILLNVKGDCTEQELKKAYRVASLKSHPDRNIGDPLAAQKFQEISEAYTILSDSNSRAVYDKYGKSAGMGEAGGEEAMPNPGELFGQLFGGKAFEDWIGEISLGKEVSKAFEQAEEEEAKQQKEETGKVSSGSPTGATTATTSNPATQSTIHHEPHSEPTSTTTSTTLPTGTTTTTTVPEPSSTSSTTTSGTGTLPGDKPSTTSSTSTQPPPPKSHLAGKPPKLTPEQKQKNYEEERKSYEEKRKRIETLSNKLRDRVRPFVEATKPGDKDDQETKRWGEKIRQESLDLAMESFGIELCHLIGEIYMQKANSYIKLHRKASSNLLGLPGFWSRMKEKGSTLKEGWSFLSTGLDVQRAMLDLEKRQEKGDLDEEEMKRLEEELSGTLLLVAWKGSKFELSAVLRQVVDAGKSIFLSLSLALYPLLHSLILPY